MVKDYTVDDITILVAINDNHFTIFDSYKIKNDTYKFLFLEQILTDYPNIAKTRKTRTLLNEWKVHNAFYNRGWFIKRTKDTDFEYKQNWFLSLAYSLCSKLFKE